MIKLLLFGEFIDSNNILLLISNKIHILSNLNGLGTYLQGIATQNTVDFIWGTTSGARSLPIALLLGLFKYLFLDYWYLVYGIFSIALIFVCFIVAVRLIKKIDAYVIMGGLLFALNYWLLNWFTSGFWQIFIAYSLLPFIITLPLSYLKNKTIDTKTVLLYSGAFAIFASIIITTQPHFLIMAGLFLILHLINVYIKSRDKFIMLLKFYFSSAVIILLLNVYILIPSIFFSERKFFPTDWYLNIRQVAFNGGGTQIENILRLAPLKYPFSPIRWSLINYIQLIPLLIVFVFFYLSKKKNWLFFICMLIFIFLAKGLHPPFTALSEWLYANFLPLHFFRDPMRFVGGITLFASLIIATYTYSNKFTFKNLGLIFLLFSILLISIKGLVQNEIRTIVRPTFIPKEYVDMQKTINNLPNDGLRLLVLPNKQSFIGYPFFDNSQPLQSTIFNMAIPLKIPMVNTVDIPDNYSRQLSSYSINSFNNDFDLSKLSTLSLKYLLVDSSINAPDNERRVATLASQMLNEKKELKKLSMVGNLTLFELQNPTSLVTTTKPVFAIGDFNSINKIKKSNQDIPVILLNQSVNSELLKPSLLRNERLSIDVENPIITLTSETLSSDYSVDLLKSVWNLKKDFTICEPYKMEFIQKEGNIFTSGRCIRTWTPNTEKVPISVTNLDGEYRVLIKALTDQVPAILSLTIGDNVIKENIDTKSKLKWLDLGNIKINEVNKIYLQASNGTPLIIDYLLIIPTSKFNLSIKNTENLLNSMDQINLENQDEIISGSNKANINIDQVSIDKPSKYLTYRYTWGQRWESNSPTTKYISDGYGMTFISEKENIKTIKYFPNLIYRLSLLFSLILLIFIILLISYIIYLKKIKDR